MFKLGLINNISSSIALQPHHALWNQISILVQLITNNSQSQKDWVIKNIMLYKTEDGISSVRLIKFVIELWNLCIDRNKAIFNSTSNNNTNLSSSHIYNHFTQVHVKRNTQRRLLGLNFLHPPKLSDSIPPGWWVWCFSRLLI